MKTAPKLQAFIRQLAEKHGVAIRQPGAYLCLELKGDLLVLEQLGPGRIAIVYQIHLFHGWVTETEIVLWLEAADGWAPIEINQMQGGWCSYAELDANGELADFQFPQGQAALADWAEGFAASLTGEGWLEQGVPSSAPRPVYTLEQMYERGLVPLEPLPVESPAAHPARMAGCQSAHPDPCYGELWQCSACKKTVCCAEGTDNHPDLCDECWVNRQAAQEDDHVPF
jgi:hypothetical protein